MDGAVVGKGTVVGGLDGMSRALREGPGEVWIRRAARVGMAARSIVYGVVGLIAVEIAWGDDSSEDDASKDGAIATIAGQPLGRALLVALAIGFLGYVAWQGSEALWGGGDEAEDDDGEAETTAKRAVSVGKALVYVVVLATTVQAIVSGPSEEGTSERQSRALTARALDLPGGQLLVGAVGVALLGAAVLLVQRGVSQRFEHRLDTSAMGRWIGTAVDVVGTAGMAARGLVVGVVGWLVLLSAIQFEPGQAAGVDGTLRRIAGQPYGRGLLTVTAVGILSFALYCLAEARYREV